MSSREKILARRASFVAAALTTITGCSSSDPTPQADTGADTRDAGPEACLSPSFDTGSEPCLSAPFDSGNGFEDTSTTDTGPMPCLIPPEDTG
jgi:hypothetical protein